MSSTFYFYKNISLNDIKEKTDIEIIYKSNDNKFPIGLKYFNTFLNIEYFGKHTKFKNTHDVPFTLNRSGSMNPNFIIDKIVNTFKTAFVVDEFYDDICYGNYNTKEERNNIFINCMNNFEILQNIYNFNE